MTANTVRSRKPRFGRQLRHHYGPDDVALTRGTRVAPHPRTGPQTVAIEVLTSREVPVGGPRAVTVRRTPPQRARTRVGAWR